MGLIGSDTFDSYKYTFSENGIAGTREIKTPYADWSSDKNELMGSSHPRFASMKCTSVNVSGLGDPVTGDGTGVGTTGNAILTANYATLSLGGGETVRTTSDLGQNISWEFGGETLTLNKNLYWTDTASSDVRIDASTGVAPIKIFPMGQIGWSGMQSDLKLAVIVGLLGKMNHATFQGLAARTLLFEGASIQRTISGEDVTKKRYQTSYRFLYNPNEWNKFYRVLKNAQPTYGKVHLADGSVATVYASDDFTTLFPAT